MMQKYDEKGSLRSDLAEAVCAKLEPAYRTVTVYHTLTSTNDAVRAAAEQGAPEGTVIIAQEQTAGRGRQGRAFFSPEGTGLYLSMLLRPQTPAEALCVLTPMAAVAAAQAVERCSGRRVQIKWVNDLLLDGRKICGILAESRINASSGIPEYAVIGIGINLRTPAGGFPPEIRDIAGAVFPAEADAETVLTDCAAGLITALRTQYGRLHERYYLKGYRERLCVLGKPVTVIENGTERPATALRVDDDLRLLVRYEDGTEQWRSTGEIRLRVGQGNASLQISSDI